MELWDCPWTDKGNWGKLIKKGAEMAVPAIGKPEGPTVARSEV